MDQGGEFRWLLGEAQVGGVLDDGQLRAGHPAVHLFQVRAAAVGQRLKGLQFMVGRTGTAVQA